MRAIGMNDFIFEFLYEKEPKKVKQALMDPDWVISKQDELNRI